MTTDTSLNLLTGVLVLAFGALIYSCGQSNKDAGLPTETLNPGYVGCVTEADLTTFNAAPHRMQIAMMMQDKCIPTSNLPAHEYVILDGFLVAHVRLLLADDQYADLYVPREATMRSHAPEAADGRE